MGAIKRMVIKLINRYLKTHKHKRFLQLAKHIAAWSKDDSTKVGCVIIDNCNRIVSTGYNGPPIKFNDKLVVNRQIKIATTIHAELNAILFAKRDLSNCTLYVTHFPCKACAAVIAQTGIKTVYTTKNEDFDRRWSENIRFSKLIFKSCKIKLWII